MPLLSIKQALASLPISVSEREFRLAARRIQANHLSGRSMMVLDTDVPAILREMEAVRRRTPRQPTRYVSAHDRPSSGKERARAMLRALDMAQKKRDQKT